MNTNLPELNDVQETLLLPLWGRAMEMKKSNPLLVDRKAESIIETLPYDFSVYAKRINRFSKASWIARSLYFDKEITDYTEKYNNVTVINIGCGLDTSFERIDNGKVAWYDLDVPEVIDLKKEYFSETDRYKFIAKSVFDYSWLEEIDEKQNIIIILAGVIYYFEENQIKELFTKLKDRFGKTEIVFDFCSKSGLKMANQKVIEKSEMTKASYLKWALDNIEDIKTLNEEIKIINSQPMFKEYKRNFPFIKRIAYDFSDGLKIMSLAHIAFE